MVSKGQQQHKNIEKNIDIFGQIDSQMENIVK